ncbi:hypothetical protein BDZ85DRAFT_263398 [Elsinoe ampelina]|uniref:F-box domain-containing protein n=1 Tax=Elsinoe ampelina TaxID=302913 RepID=A0A6A6G987_9PEZI|nr:hypothetical protein BDZ85DRAFT_263398 [Elsinoe ampelina]
MEQSNSRRHDSMMGRKRDRSVSPADAVPDAARTEKRARPSIPTLECFLNPARFPTIRSAIVKHLNVKDLLRLCATTKHIQGHIRSHEWSIDRHLRHFFDSPRDFRSMQAATGTLIFGDFATRFMGFETFELHTMTLVVREGVTASKLRKHLEHQQGYSLHSENDDLQHPRSTQTFTSERRGTSMTVHVELVENPVNADIMDLFTTSVATSFISSNKAYHLFPRTSFKLRETLPFELHSKSDRKYHQLWASRGWRARRREWHDPPSLDQSITGQECATGPIPGKEDLWVSRHRRVGDHISWTLPLGLGQIAQSNLAEELLESTSFSFATPYRSPPDGFDDDWEVHRILMDANMSYSLLESPVLRHCYCVSDLGGGFGVDGLLTEIEKLLNRSVAEQVSLLEQDGRESLFGRDPPDSVYRVRPPPGLPEWWIYEDDAVLRYISVWERKCAASSGGR